jgi:hypothetical protein
VGKVKGYFFIFVDDISNNFVECNCHQKGVLLVKYKKGNTNKMTTLLSRPRIPKIIVLDTFVQMELLPHGTYKDKSIKLTKKDKTRLITICKLGKLCVHKG